MTDKKEIFDLLESRVGNGLGDKKTLLVTLDSPFLDNPYVFPYLGILYLLGVADASGLPVHYFPPDIRSLDIIGNSASCMCYTDNFNIDDLALYADFDVIGISCMTPQGLQAYHICRTIKHHFPEKTVIIGGPHAKFYLEDCLDKGFDIIVIGDGERIFEAMITGDFEFLWRKAGNRVNQTLVLSDNLSAKEMNAYPIPYREKAYLHQYRYYLEGIPATTLVNSRGCPMRCAFCEHSGTASKWFWPHHFEAEISDILAKSFNGIMIFDDLFAMSPKKVQPYLEILKRYHKRYGTLFRCFGHANILSKNPILLKMLAEAGCVEIGIGAESASQKILDNIGKRTTVSQLHASVNLAVRNGVKIKTFFMIGLPGETEQTATTTHDFIKFYRKKYPDFFDFDLSVFFPFRGTLIGDAIRMKSHESSMIGGRPVSRTTYDLRLSPGYTWDMIDSGMMGAYKKKGGASDLVIESYSWESRKVLLSAKQILEFKNRTMNYSGRYANLAGQRHFNSLVEGNIGQKRQAAVCKTA